MKTLQRWGTDRPCALDMCNTARSFTHESNTCVMRRLAFLILDFIHPLSCIQPPTTLLSTIFGRGAGSWHSPRTQELLKYKRSSVRFSALPSVCAQRRACATIPRPTFSSYNPELLSTFSTILRERKHGSKPLTRSKISEISQWQKCFSELKISISRISCTLNGVRRSSWKVVWVAESSYDSETSIRWQIFCSCSWRAIDIC